MIDEIARARSSLDLFGLRSQPYPIETQHAAMTRIVAGLETMRSAVDLYSGMNNAMVDTNFGVVFQSGRHLKPLEETIILLSEDAKLHARFAAGMTVLFAVMLIGVVLASRNRLIVPAIQELARAYEQRTMFQQALNQKSQLIASAFLAIEDAVVVFDRNGYLVVANGSFSSLMEQSDAPDPLSFLVSHMSSKPAFTPDLSQWEKLQAVQRHLDAQPSTLINGKILSWVCTTTDSDDLIFVARDQTQITMQFEADKHVARLEALGRVSGGVAHDFNNILAGITMRAEMMGEDPETPPNVAAELRGFVESSERAKKMISQLLAYAQKRSFSIETVSTERALLMLRSQLAVPRNVTLSLTNNATRCFRIDRQHFVTAIENLVRNSVYSIGSEPGRIAITLQDRQSGSDPAMVGVVITDTGTGFAEEALRQGHQLFFTTKSPGEGSGLGLAMVGETMQRLGGNMTLSNTPDGAQVELFFPATAIAEGPNVVHLPSLSPPTTDLRHRQSCLLLEDDPILGDLQKRYLQRRFQTTTLCRSVEEALDVISGDHPYDVSIFDWNLPDGTSENAVLAFMAKYKSARTILTTGNPDANFIKRFSGKSIVLLKKPVSLQQLETELTRPQPEWDAALSMLHEFD
ncbi:ATP-binding protein [Palleronia caenipelagi]|uniref:ATP-binding protein n=1 Tax=Palleronia caenipelagi TaxID=2489174 RepID=UPI00163DCB89|nr:ATP-binding protein [Palleronia caenipelagi]